MTEAQIDTGAGLLTTTGTAVSTNTAVSTETETGAATEAVTEVQTETPSAVTTPTSSGIVDYDTRTITVLDRRTTVSNNGKTTASVPKTFAGNVYLRIDDSTGAQIKYLMDQKYGYDEIEPFTMVLANAMTGGSIITEFGGRCTVTMLASETLKNRRKINQTASLYTVTSRGALEKQYAIVSDVSTTDDIYYMFSTDHMGEYAFVVNEKEKETLEVKDQRRERNGTVSASVVPVAGDTTNGLYLTVENNDGTDVKQVNLVPLVQETDAYKASYYQSYYDLVLYKTTANGDEIVDTNFKYKIYMHLPLPTDMDLSQGKISAVYTYQESVGTAGETVRTPQEAEDISYGKEADGTSYVEFAAPHLTEYAVLYQRFKDVVNDTGTYAGEDDETSSTERKKKPESNDTPAAPAAAADQPASAAGTGTAATPAAAGAATAAAAATTRGGAAASTPAAQSAGKGGSSGSSGGKVDMPKTADMTTYRNVLVMLMLVFGALLIVSCLRVRKADAEK